MFVDLLFVMLVFSLPRAAVVNSVVIIVALVCCAWVGLLLWLMFCVTCCLGLLLACLMLLCFGCYVFAVFCVIIVHVLL